MKARILVIEDEMSINDLLCMNPVSYTHLMALFMSISEGIPEIKLAKVKMKMEFQRESEGVLL